MRKIYIFIILMLIITIIIHPLLMNAQNKTKITDNTHLTAIQAQNIGAAFMRNANNNLRNQTLQLVYTGRTTDSLTRSTTDCYYVFGLQPKGFVIVSADIRVEPIIGYSFDNNFETNEIPENVILWLDNYKQQIKIVTEQNISSSNEISNKWAALKHGQPLATRNGSSVTPLVSTKWSQSNPYNELCPVDERGPGGHAYAGCVAVAMGQIIHYWKYPTSGIGSNTYDCNFVSSGYGNYGILSANFSETTYDYTLMPNILNGNSPYNQIYAVAQLLYHCGIASTTKYSYNKSGSSDAKACGALVNHFGFPYAHVEDRSNYSDSEWLTLIKGELDSLRPLYYGGTSTTGGHGFVCDGYDNQDYFHINWGWGGNYDGYYSLSYLSPYFDGSTVYNIQQSAIIGVYVPQPMIHPNFRQLLFITNEDSVYSSKTVSIIATSLTSPITATVSGNFTISTNDTNFTTSQTMSSNGGTLYIRHHPSEVGITDHDYIILVSDNIRDSIALTGNTFRSSCNPPQNLTITSSDMQHINLQWEAPQTISDPVDLSWSNDTISRYLRYRGSPGDQKLSMMQRFCDTDLVAHHNKELTAIRFFARNDVTKYKAVVYKGGCYSCGNSYNGEYNSGTLVYSQDIDINSIIREDWNTVTLDTPVLIDATQELWYGIYLEAPENALVIPVCNSSVPTKGSICGIHTDSTLRWREISSSYTFCTNGTIDYVQAPMGYQISRNGTYIHNTTSNTNMQDSVAIPNNLLYTVSANYNNGCSASVQKSFNTIPTECPQIEDIDHNLYQSVKIGSKCWMAENLRTTHYADGRDITNIYRYNVPEYPNEDENVATFGLLYDWYDALDSNIRRTRAPYIQGICPNGWHIPTASDFEELNSLDLHTLRSTNYWFFDTGDNATGFDLRPAGMYNYTSQRFESLMSNAFLWSAEEISSTTAHCHMAKYNCYMIIDLIQNKKNAYSVRCIKD